MLYLSFEHRQHDHLKDLTERKLKIFAIFHLDLDPYLKKVPRSGAQHLQDLVVSRVLTELEEHLPEQLQYCVGRYIYKPQKKLLRVLASLKSKSES